MLKDTSDKHSKRRLNGGVGEWKSCWGPIEFNFTLWNPDDVFRECVLVGLFDLLRQGFI